MVLGSRSVGRRGETLALLVSALALVASSGVTLKALSGPTRWPESAEVSIPTADRGEAPHAPAAWETLDDRVPEAVEAAPAPLNTPDLALSVEPIDPPPRQADPPAPRRVRVGDDRGRSLVARMYGGDDSRVVLLPDGSLGWPNALIETDEPFAPLSADAMARELSDGPYRHFQLHRTPHYLVFYAGSAAFARKSGSWLEAQLNGLMRSLADDGLDVREPEFPLVAVIFRNEGDFREHREVPPDVQAYYEVVSNRIFFYETREGEPESPEAAALRGPQTIAHEGTHQVLQNIGIQPRLARWPLWLVEGLAEYFTPTEPGRAEWGRLNPQHLATLHEVEATRQPASHAPRLGGAGPPGWRELGDAEELTPTGYASAWALTHHLMTRRRPELAAYLRSLAALPPLARPSADDQDRLVRAAFGEPLAALAASSRRRMLSQKGYEALPYFVVTFEQPIGDEFVRRGAVVSQSPLVVRQWLEGMIGDGDSPYQVHARAFPGRAAAFRASDEWLSGR